MRNNQAVSKVIEEGEGRGAQNAAAEIVGAVAPEENHGGAGICQWFMERAVPEQTSALQPT